jgi:endonuclease III
MVVKLVNREKKKSYTVCVNIFREKAEEIPRTSRILQEHPEEAVYYLHFC